MNPGVKSVKCMDTFGEGGLGSVTRRQVVGQFTPLEGKLHESGALSYILAPCRSAWSVAGGQHKCFLI